MPASIAGMKPRARAARR